MNESSPRLDAFEGPWPYPGRLFIVEGVDGSGKSTQLTLLAQWLPRLLPDGVAWLVKP